ncbi:MAG TPA: prepilin peptidase [Halococcus sp.]|nr:prepilin peptidase [Halococcus sp.]
MVNAPTDVLRLLCLPLFGWAAYRDLRTRRVPNRTWLPLFLLGGVLLVWDGWNTSTLPAAERLLALRVAISIGVLVPFCYLFWRFGAFGGADAKALTVLCVLFPTVPSFSLAHSVTLPLAEASGVFSLTILTNAALLGGTYPLVLFAQNARAGRFSLVGFVGKPVEWNAISKTYGRMLAGANGLDRGIDLDALRMYLVWRDTTLRELRAAPDSFRDPASLPSERNAPGDGAVGPIADGGTSECAPDPWGAKAFLADIDGDAYGTTPASLRAVLDTLTSSETIWVSPGIPFLVPLFCGLCVALVYGDLLYAVMGVLGVF